MGYRVRHAAWGGSFEGHPTVGVGVRARLPLRTTLPASPTDSRLVLDVAHSYQRAVRG